MTVDGYMTLIALSFGVGSLAASVAGLGLASVPTEILVRVDELRKTA